MTVAPLSIIDFISIIPFYIEVIAKHDTVGLFQVELWMESLPDYIV